MNSRVAPHTPSAHPPRNAFGLSEAAEGQAEKEQHQHDPSNKSIAKIHSFEDVLNVIRPLGLWQGLIFLQIAYMQYWASMVNLATVFFSIQPPFYCNNDQSHQNIQFPSNWTFEQIRNFSLVLSLCSVLTGPVVADFITAGIWSPLEEDNKTLDTCRTRNLTLIPDFNLGNMSFANAYSAYKGQLMSVNTTPGCPNDDFLFDTTRDMKLTIVNQWDLVCDSSSYVDHAQMVYMAGFLIGSFVGGMISDRFGRKYTFIIAGFTSSCLGVAQGHAPVYWGFLLIRFCMALFGMASGMAGFCLMLEVCTNKYRDWVGGLFYIPYALGYASVAIFAYFFRDWRVLHTVIAAPQLLIITFIWTLPESPRWYLVKGRTTEAAKTLEKAAKINKADGLDGIDFDKIAKAVAEEHHQSQAKQESFFRVFRYPMLSRRVINLFFNWFVNSMVYYGVSLNVSSFDGDRFVNNGIAGLVEIPAYMLCVPLLMCGRRWALMGTLMIAGLSLIVIPWVPLKPFGLQLTLAMVGKLCITASFAIVYVVTLELYPTVIRNSGLANSSCVSRFGSIIAPYISSISKRGGHWKSVPMWIFGSFSIAAALLTLILPETKGMKLPDTFEEALHLEPESEKSKEKSSPT